MLESIVPMKPRIRVAEARTPDGKLLELYEHDGAHDIVVDRRPLMSSRKHQSEEDLASLVCHDLSPGAHVLIGGLGLGFTLRAALDLLPIDAQVTQVELIPEVVAWNETLMGHHADHPLRDPRTHVIVDDVRRVITRNQGALHAVILDVDNGPDPMVTTGNAWLYTEKGLRAIHRALVPGGRVAVWSAQDDTTFLRTLRRSGFDARRHLSSARPRGKGGRHFVFVGRRR